MIIIKKSYFSVFLLMFVGSLVRADEDLPLYAHYYYDRFQELFIATNNLAEYANLCKTRFSSECPGGFSQASYEEVVSLANELKLFSSKLSISRRSAASKKINNFPQMKAILSDELNSFEGKLLFFNIDFISRYIVVNEYCNHVDDGVWFDGVRKKNENFYWGDKNLIDQAVQRTIFQNKNLYLSILRAGDKSVTCIALVNFGKSIGINYKIMIDDKQYVGDERGSKLLSAETYVFANAWLFNKASVDPMYFESTKK